MQGETGFPAAKLRTGEEWAVVINRSSGSDADAERLAHEVKSLFQQHGLTARVRLVPGPELEPVCREALRQGIAGLAAGGGDGTLSTVAGILAGGDVPMGVLPMGTLNHFAKDLGIPLELPEAVRVIAEGRASRIDLGEVNGEVFINNSSIGGYPWVIRTRELHRQRHGRPKWLAHLVAFVGFLRRFRTMRVKLNLEGRETTLKTSFVCVGNNEYALDAGAKVARGSLSGGLLGVYTARCDHWMQFLRLFFLLLAKRLEDDPGFDIHRVGEVEIITRKKRQHVSRDGEVFLMEMPLHYRIRPAALAVFVPAGPDNG